MKEPIIETIVRGVLIHDGQVLLCQNRKHGHLFLPGGHVDFGELARVALMREAIEEMGVSLEVGRFLGGCESIFDQPRRSGEGVRRHHEVNLVFQLRFPGSGSPIGQLTSQEEHIAFVWMPITDLAKEGGPRVLPQQIAPLITAAARLGDEPSSAIWY